MRFSYFSIDICFVDYVSINMDSSYLWVSKSAYNQFIQPDGKNLHWTDDINFELPIFMESSGPGASPPMTFINIFQDALQTHAQQPALRVKRGGKWVTWTYQQYYDDSLRFARAAINLGIKPRAVTNIIGFNAPEWLISFAGSLIANLVPIGVYTTNGPEACFYIANHSEAELLIVQNEIQLKKYLAIWDKLPRLKAIIVYLPGAELESLRAGKQIFTWEEFMATGSDAEGKELAKRMREISPAQCATVVYTSGTTGPPKGVLLSHDNYIWCAKSCVDDAELMAADPNILVSYLPLSHSAAQIIDIFGCMYKKGILYFADENCLQGTLGNTLKEVRPTFFMSVPRVFEKIEERIKAIAASKGSFAKKVGTWAKKVGYEGTIEQLQQKPTSLSFSIANAIIFKKIKQALGLDRCKAFIVSAAPIAKSTLEYFLSLNIPLLNVYGMSECAAPETMNYLHNNNIWSVGQPVNGTRLKILSQSGEEVPRGTRGEICMKGRNRFMGYYKNETETKATIDKNGFLHSGDEGYLNEKGFLFITGRFKELIITAGGENIPPVLIEDTIKEECKLISNCMLVGDHKNYLALLLAIKTEPGPDLSLTRVLSGEALRILAEIGSTAKTYDEAMSDQKVKKYIQEGIDRANKRAISKAQHVRKWVFLPNDFSLQGGELTPTMKLKRKFVAQKYASLIEELYTSPNL
ncbi:unnamed protein product [Blepharisma stoltei]|uniref:AMP-dependent synthetase/ligase domain-containing protein n=1 Tax=Blepharisma stoltei TaxID=1481888 RepID=A0AAU9J2J8_9CILI|nr:unnamed protein product [Blepharisma stoltei]